LEKTTIAPFSAKVANNQFSRTHCSAESGWPWSFQTADNVTAANFLWHAIWRSYEV